MEEQNFSALIVQQMDLFIRDPHLFFPSIDVATSHDNNYVTSSRFIPIFTRNKLGEF